MNNNKIKGRKKIFNNGRLVIVIPSGV